MKKILFVGLIGLSQYSFAETIDANEKYFVAYNTSQAIKLSDLFQVQMQNLTLVDGVAIETLRKMGGQNLVQTYFNRPDLREKLRLQVQKYIISDAGREFFENRSTQFFSELYSSDELKALYQFSKSENGKKFVDSSLAADVKTQKFVNDAYQEITNKENKDKFEAEVEKVFSELQQKINKENNAKLINTNSTQGQSSEQKESVVKQSTLSGSVEDIKVASAESSLEEKVVKPSLDQPLVYTETIVKQESLKQSVETESKQVIVEQAKDSDVSPLIKEVASEENSIQSIDAQLIQEQSLDNKYINPQPVLGGISENTPAVPAQSPSVDEVTKQPASDQPSEYSESISKSASLNQSVEIESKQVVDVQKQDLGVGLNGAQKANKENDVESTDVPLMQDQSFDKEESIHPQPALGENAPAVPEQLPSVGDITEQSVSDQGLEYSESISKSASLNQPVEIESKQVIDVQKQDLDVGLGGTQKANKESDLESIDVPRIENQSLNTKESINPQSSSVVLTQSVEEMVAIAAQPALDYSVESVEVEPTQLVAEQVKETIATTNTDAASIQIADIVVNDTSSTDIRINDENLTISESENSENESEDGGSELNGH